MNQVLTALDGIAGGMFGTLILVHLRLLGCIITLPGFGERSVPVRLKVALAIALTPVFAPLASGPLPSGSSALLAAAAGELAVGLTFGLTVRLIAATLSIAAAAIASTASLAQLIGGENEMAPHPIGNLLHLGGLAVLMALGFPIMVADYLAQGFGIWPLGGVPDPVVLAPGMVAVMARAFGLAMILASPFILGGLLYQSLSGVIGKVMPALPVVFVGAPLAVLLALIGLSLFAVPLIGVWADAVLDTKLPTLFP